MAVFQRLHEPARAEIAITAVQHLQGQKVPPVIDTGVQIVTPENVKTPEMAQLLDPPVAQYLK